MPLFYRRDRGAIVVAFTVVSVRVYYNCNSISNDLSQLYSFKIQSLLAALFESTKWLTFRIQLKKNNNKFAIQRKKMYVCMCAQQIGFI